VINISVSIGDVTTEITTDSVLSFDGIDTLLNRATISALTAYKEYFVANEHYETLAEDDE
jgi:hypothetical protein